jgi:hypothetical protein
MWERAQSSVSRRAGCGARFRHGFDAHSGTSVLVDVLPPRSFARGIRRTHVQRVTMVHIITIQTVLGLAKPKKEDSVCLKKKKKKRVPKTC